MFQMLRYGVEHTFSPFENPHMYARKFEQAVCYSEACYSCANNDNFQGLVFATHGRFRPVFRQCVLYGVRQSGESFPGSGAGSTLISLVLQSIWTLLSTFVSKEGSVHLFSPTI